MSVIHKGSRESSEVYVGCVLCTRERNYHDDSDFYVVVWDEESQSLKEVIYYTTRCACDGVAHADATPEVIEKAGAWLKKWAIDRVREEFARDAQKAAETINKGDQVRVVKGRKVPLGTAGTVIWKGEQSYGQSYPRHGYSRGYNNGFYGQTVTRVGIKDAEGTVFWTSITNVEKVDQALKIPSEAEIEAKAQVAVDHRLFHLPFARRMGIALVV